MPFPTLDDDHSATTCCNVSSKLEGIDRTPVGCYIVGPSSRRHDVLPCRGRIIMCTTISSGLCKLVLLMNGNKLEVKGTQTNLNKQSCHQESLHCIMFLIDCEISCSSRNEELAKCARTTFETLHRSHWTIIFHLRSCKPSVKQAVGKRLCIKIRQQESHCSWNGLVSF